jgi:hypothetical protein
MAKPTITHVDEALIDALLAAEDRLDASSRYDENTSIFGYLARFVARGLRLTYRAWSGRLLAGHPPIGDRLRRMAAHEAR